MRHCHSYQGGMIIFQLECCGVNNYTEYGAHLADLPLSCFKVYDTLSVHTKSWTLLFTVGLDSSTRDLNGFKLFAFICCNYCKYCCLCSKWYEYLKNLVYFRRHAFSSFSTGSMLTYQSGRQYWFSSASYK